MTSRNEYQPGIEPGIEEDRRKFLATCGRFAAVTTPALTILLSTSLNTDAIASSVHAESVSLRDVDPIVIERWQPNRQPPRYQR